MEALWKKEYSLAAVTAPDQFKTYEELERRMNMVLGNKSAPTRSREVAEQEDSYSSYEEKSSVTENRVVEELEKSYARSKAPVSKVEPDEDEDDALSYFSRLAEE
jgi:hypothetical protein